MKIIFARNKDPHRFDEAVRAALDGLPADDAAMEGDFAAFQALQAAEDKKKKRRGGLWLFAALLLLLGTTGVVLWGLKTGTEALPANGHPAPGTVSIPAPPPASGRPATTEVPAQKELTAADVPAVVSVTADGSNPRSKSTIAPAAVVTQLPAGAAKVGAPAAGSSVTPSPDPSGTVAPSVAVLPAATAKRPVLPDSAARKKEQKTDTLMIIW